MADKKLLPGLLRARQIVADRRMEWERRERDAAISADARHEALCIATELRHIVEQLDMQIAERRESASDPLVKP